MDYQEKFRIVCRYLLDVEPTDEVCTENAEIFVKLIELRLEDRSDEFFDFCIKQQAILDERATATRKRINGYSNIEHFDGLDINLSSNDIMALLNMSTLSISCMRQLIDVEKNRYRAFSHFSTLHLPAGYNNSIVVEHFLCGTIYNQESIISTLKMIDSLK